MSSFSKYQVIKTLYEDVNIVVYRGQIKTNQQPIIIKVLKEEYPTPEKIAWFKREYELLHHLDLEDVPVVYSIENHQNHYMMVMEDFGGESLAKLKLIGQLKIVDFLELALNITNILGKIHQKQIIHKDINPSNIVLNPTTQKVKIIDFGISTVLSSKNVTFQNLNVLEGTLAYISPEQTGRMNRIVDYHTDFYSLGVTFYQLLTGQLPFQSDDALELIHHHIAKQPIPPHQLRTDIPPIISAIILKLMAKNAEDRYQSAFGLKYDLQKCLEQANHLADLSFKLGNHDFSDKFIIQQKLYGREPEIQTLLQTFAQVTSHELAESEKKGELILVAGHSGVGKSVLVNEIHKPITEKRGYFIKGKYDQFQRDIPYYAWIQAFTELVNQWLTETQTNLDRWKANIQEALGDLGQVLTDMIPNLSLLIGKQPDVPELGATEAQNRFNYILQKFIKVIAQQEHPLVIFLDDFQWADMASLKLLKALMTSSDNKYLLIIGAYRDNEVTPTHPLMLNLEEMQKEQIAVRTIVLQSLLPNDVHELLRDALGHSNENIHELSDLVYKKTQGNAFFVHQFLKSLY